MTDQSRSARSFRHRQKMHSYASSSPSATPRLRSSIQGPEVQEQMRAHQEARRNALLDIALDNNQVDAHLAQFDAVQQQFRAGVELA